MGANLQGLNAGHAYVVTPSDTVLLPMEAVSIYIGTTGGALNVVTDYEWGRINNLMPGSSVSAKLAAANKTLFSALPVGYTLNLRVAAIFSTGTVATPIIALVDI